MSDPIVEIPTEGYESDMSLNDIKIHLSTLYTYGAKCISVREIGPSGMFSSGAILYGLLHNTSPTNPVVLADISISVIEDMCKPTQCFSRIQDVYPNIDYKWIRSVRPSNPSDNADMYYIPIWHFTDDGTTLFTNSRSGTANLVNRIKECSEYTNKYMIIHEACVIDIHEKYIEPEPIEPTEPTEPTEPVRFIDCIDPMYDHAERLGLTIETVRGNILNTIQTFVTENPIWTIVKTYQDGGWVTIIEKMSNR